MHLYKSTHPGTKLHIKHRPIEEAHAACEKAAPEFWSVFSEFVGCYMEEERFGIGDEEASNGSWKEWNPKSIADYVMTLA